VELGPSKRRLVAGFVPGIGYACFAPWLQPPTTPAEHVRKYGYDLRLISVDALSSTVTNASQIRDAVMTMPVEPGPPRLVLIGYSKGTLDILDAVVRYPEIRGRVAAVVSIAGAVGGSVLARDATQQQLDLLRYWPDANCEAGDGEGVASLRPDARKAWFAQNTLPPNLRYYSVVTLPDRARISRLVVPGYRTLSQIDPRNDGQVIYSDQFVPGSTLLGFLNADHWAVLVPVTRSHAVIGGLFVDQNDYPREALLEAVLRFVEEDLSRKRIDHPRTPRKLGIALKRKMIQSMSYSPATAGCVRSVRPMPTTPGPASQGRSRPESRPDATGMRGPRLLRTPSGTERSPGPSPGALPWRPAGR
jgi:hypothetical protein